MNGIRSKLEKHARRELTTRLQARGRIIDARGALPEAEAQLLLRLTCVGFAGIGNLIARSEGSSHAVAGRLQEICEVGAHAHDLPAQARVIESCFLAASHDLLVRLTFLSEPIRRVEMREYLAACVHGLAQGLLAALAESGGSESELLRELQEAPADIDDLLGLAAEKSGLRLPDGYGNGRWSALRSAPLFAVLHVSAAASNGPAGLINEFRAANREVLHRAIDRESGSFVGALFHSGLCSNQLCTLANEHASQVELMKRLHRVVAKFDSVSPREGYEFRQVIEAAANAAAHAAREPVLHARRWQLENEVWALDEIHRLTRWPSSTTSSFSA